MNTAQSVMESLQALSEKTGVIDWQTYMVGAGKLCALLQTEDDKLAEMEHRFIKVKAAYIEEGKPANQAKLLAESNDEYLELLKQRAFVKRCNETIAIAKKMATLSKEAYFNQM